MLLSAAGDAIVNFIKEEYVLLIIIAIAIVLLIVVSLLGRKKKSKTEGGPKEGEQTAENAAADEAAQPVEKTEAEDEKEPLEENSEEGTEEKTEEKAEEKSEEKAEEKSEEKVEVKAEEKAEEKVEDAEEKSADEVAEKTETKPEDEVLAAEALAIEDEEEEVEEMKNTAKEEKKDVVAEAATAEEEAHTRPGIVEIYKGKEDFYFTFRSFHGYLIGRSQGYASKESCKNGVKAVMNACAEAEIYDNTGKNAVADYAPAIGKTVFELYKDKAGKFRFRLFAKNRQNIAASEDYTTKSNLKNAIGSLKKIAENYTLKDSTLKRKPKAVKD